jgi:hypothetical protein
MADEMTDEIRNLDPILCAPLLVVGWRPSETLKLKSPAIKNWLRKSWT